VGAEASDVVVAAGSGDHGENREGVEVFAFSDGRDCRHHKCEVCVRTVSQRPGLLTLSRLHLSFDLDHKLEI
jgi:hypothetical protein